jgi:hypothetical protein
MNPLWIISLFLGLSEVTVGIAATQSTGWIQGLLAVFSILFPVGVATIFFVILWSKPFVLYAPRDYPEKTNVTSFVEAMTISATGQSKTFDKLLGSAVENALKRQLPDDKNEQRIQAEVQKALRLAHEQIKESSIFIDVSELESTMPRLAIPVFDDRDVRLFMDELWVALRWSGIQPYTYGKDWVLEDSRDGRRLDRIDGRPARQYLDAKLDSATISDFGLNSGVVYVVRLLTNTAIRSIAG